MRLSHSFPALPLLAVLLASTAAQDEGLDAAVSLGVLKERLEYAVLDQQAVEALARAAEVRWPQQFSGFTYQRTERCAAGGVSHWISTWSHDKTGLEFALVPGGRFQMGSPASEADRQDDELQHWVTLEPFLIARTECTQEAWARLAGPAGLKDAPSFFEGSDQFPVERVSIEDVESWCLQAQLMLPTEAQWEFACRSGTTSAWAMGADKSGLKWFGNLGSAECPEDWIEHELGITEPWHDGYGNQIASVGSFDCNAFGLFDMHGNVREWCRDDYFGYEAQVEGGAGARLGTSGQRVHRGGSFNSPATLARSANRSTSEAGLRARFLGFRPALDLSFAVSLEDWASETFELPPGFAPDLPPGIESLRFAPGWRDPSSEEFWSYAFVMWIDEPAPDAARIGELLDSYYDGLVLTFAESAQQDIGSDPAQVAVTRTASNHFEAQMHVIDAFATFEPIDLRILVDTVALAEEHSALHIQLSPQPAEHAIWRALHAAVRSIEKP